MVVAGERRAGDADLKAKGEVSVVLGGLEFLCAHDVRREAGTLAAGQRAGRNAGENREVFGIEPFVAFDDDGGRDAKLLFDLDENFFQRSGLEACGDVLVAFLIREVTGVGGEGVGREADDFVGEFVRLLHLEVIANFARDLLVGLLDRRGRLGGAGGAVLRDGEELRVLVVEVLHFDFVDLDLGCDLSAGKGEVFDLHPGGELVAKTVRLALAGEVVFIVVEKLGELGFSDGRLLIDGLVSGDDDARG